MEEKGLVMERVEPYLVGICTASVCAEADASPEEIEREVNAHHPTGISSHWRVSGTPAFSGGESNPCPCNTEPDARRHWLLEC